MRPAALPDTTWRTFLRIIRARPAGTSLTVDDVRWELEAADIPRSAYGALFKAACVNGHLWTNGWTRPSTEPSARGRRCLVYYTPARQDPWEEAS